MFTVSPAFKNTFPCFSAMKWNAFAFLKPLYPQLIPLFLLHTLHQFVFKTQIHIFSSQVSRTHAADSAFMGAHMLTPEPHTSALLPLSSYRSKSVKLSLSLCLCEWSGVRFSSPEQRLSAVGQDSSLWLLQDQYYTGLKLDLQSAAVSPHAHRTLEIYFFPLS